MASSTGGQAERHETLWRMRSLDAVILSEDSGNSWMPSHPNAERCRTVGCPVPEEGLNPNNELKLTAFCDPEKRRIDVEVQINHIGITVEDIASALDWYSDVLGFVTVFGPIQEDASGRAGVVFGERFGRMRRAVMASPLGVGLEFFEFSNPPTERSPTFEYWKSGPFHICFTVADVVATVRAIEMTGGVSRTGPLDAGSGRHIAYCEDPFGNILEFTDRTILDTYGGR